MNSAPAAHDAVDTPWHPPIELSRYDRTATLAAAERAALAVIAPRNQQWNQHRVAYRQALQTLARLRQPILETLTILGYHPRRHTDIWGVLAETMRQTGQAYWGWDDTAWETATCSRSQDWAPDAVPLHLPGQTHQPRVYQPGADPDPVPQGECAAA